MAKVKTIDDINLEGKKVLLTGKVKTHDISKFSNCKETVMNYVKIEE